jgi:zinc transporter ZupT
MAKPAFLRELRRRHVFRVAVAYAVVGWLLIQIATQVFPFFNIPNWSVRLLVLLVLAGFPVALVLAWAFDATPHGLVRTTPDR